MSADGGAGALAHARVVAAHRRTAVARGGERDVGAAQQRRGALRAGVRDAGRLSHGPSAATPTTTGGSNGTPSTT